MPSGENLAAFAATGAVLAIHLSVHVAEQVQAELLPHYGADCPAAIVWRASWGDETIVRTRVGEIAQAAQANPLQRSALILVGATLAQEGFGFSRLYADDYDRRWRPRGDEPRFPVPDADEPAHGDGEPRASTPDEVPATSQAREGGRADA
jgi:precorrin-4/cobalt-precorrin-4 C11-methyltransferase